MAHMDPYRMKHGRSIMLAVARLACTLIVVMWPLAAQARVFLRRADDAGARAGATGLYAPIRVLSTRMVVNGRPTLLTVTATPEPPTQAVAHPSVLHGRGAGARRVGPAGPYATWATPRSDASLRRFAMRLSPFGGTLLFEFKTLDEPQMARAAFPGLSWPSFPGCRELSAIAMPDRHLAVKVMASEAPVHRLLDHFGRLARSDGWKPMWPPAGPDLGTRVGLWMRQQDILIVSVDSAGPRTPNVVTVLFKRTETSLAP